LEELKKRLKCLELQREKKTTTMCKHTEYDFWSLLNISVPLLTVCFAFVAAAVTPPLFRVAEVSGSSTAYGCSGRVARASPSLPPFDSLPPLCDRKTDLLHRVRDTFTNAHRASPAPPPRHHQDHDVRFGKAAHVPDNTPDIITPDPWDRLPTLPLLADISSLLSLLPPFLKTSLKAKLQKDKESLFWHPSASWHQHLQCVASGRV